MAEQKFPNLVSLAEAMGLSVSQVYRVREGKRGINQKFIVGASRAFPECGLEELFFITPEVGSGGRRRPGAAGSDLEISGRSG